MTKRSLSTRRLLILVAVLCVWRSLFSVNAVAATAPNYYLLVVNSLGGETYYTDLFNRWGTTMMDVAIEQLGIQPEYTTWLGETGDVQPDRMTDRSTRDNIIQAIEKVAQSSKAGDSVLIVLIGHGTASRDRALFNVPGPDLSATDLSLALLDLQERNLAIVNTTPSSAPFIQALSRKGRIIITATANRRENHHTRFGGEFVSAWVNNAADRNKDKRVSLLEAFNFSQQQTERFYETEGRLLTEHAQLDDNGDSIGSRQPLSPESDDNLDGLLASRFFFDPIDLMTDASDVDSETARQRLLLKIDARKMVDRIESLKRKKNVMTNDDFNDQLETLLVELALNRRKWRTPND